MTKALDSSVGVVLSGVLVDYGEPKEKVRLDQVSLIKGTAFEEDFLDMTEMAKEFILFGTHLY